MISSDDTSGQTFKSSSGRRSRKAVLSAETIERAHQDGYKVRFHSRVLTASAPAHLDVEEAIPVHVWDDAVLTIDIRDL